MVSISNARLAITPNWKDQTARVRVTCEVHFTEEEVAYMSRKPGRMYFSLYCWLYGHDASLPKLSRLHDELYAFSSRILPSGEPVEMEEVTFETTLSQNLLNEDVVGSDEIFAQVELHGWIRFKGLFEVARTNVISYAFA